MPCNFPKVIHVGSMQTQISCGKCAGCRKARASEWTTRLVHELEFWTSASFITLTYDDAKMPLDENGNQKEVLLNKEDLQKYLKRVRRRTAKEIRYYACGEYGSKRMRAHYHIILYGLDILEPTLVNCWPYGDVFLGSVTGRSCAYVAGYVQKKIDGELLKKILGDVEEPFTLVSKGLGEKFLEKYGIKVKSDLMLTNNGTHIKIPRYYRKKLNITSADTDPLSKEYKEEVIKTHEKRTHKETETSLYSPVLNSLRKSRIQNEKNILAANKLKEDKL